MRPRWSVVVVLLVVGFTLGWFITTMYRQVQDNRRDIHERVAFCIEHPGTC